METVDQSTCGNVCSIVTYAYVSALRSTSVVRYARVSRVFGCAQRVDQSYRLPIYLVGVEEFIESIDHVIHAIF